MIGCTLVDLRLLNGLCPVQWRIYEEIGEVVVNLAALPRIAIPVDGT